jgi:hypothetical protein
MKIKIVTGVVVILVLMIGAPSVYADSKCPPEGCDLPHAKDPQAAYQAGFQHGKNEGFKYILQPRKSFAFHTKEFNQGFIDGFCNGDLNGGGSDADAATFDCSQMSGQPNAIIR